MALTLAVGVGNSILADSLFAYANDFIGMNTHGSFFTRLHCMLASMGNPNFSTPIFGLGINHPSLRDFTCTVHMRQRTGIRRTFHHLYVCGNSMTGTLDRCLASLQLDSGSIGSVRIMNKVLTKIIRSQHPSSRTVGNHPSHTDNFRLIQLWCGFILINKVFANHIGPLCQLHQTVDGCAHQGQHDQRHGSHHGRCGGQHVLGAIKNTANNHR